ncbi:MAG: hypothetical protein L6M37_05300 [Candidatus Methylarchaceae archaeon HK02M1]|nr:hypothetical protein [Candidatus Methylarchaceae archaeon HK01M]MCP8312348.1 hypothetical protein [Candidatus Methylarchaceae archaeon HK02M1]
MSWQIVKGYKAYWRPEMNYGVLTIYYGTTFNQQKIESPQELLILVDLLRNEKPVWFHTVTKAIVTGVEPVGEEET